MYWDPLRILEVVAANSNLGASAVLSASTPPAKPARCTDLERR